jgi:Fe2+ transport system protein FeoA
MKLSESKPKQFVTITNITKCNRLLRLRLMELGLLPGVTIEIISICYLGQVLLLRVRNCTLSIRIFDAQYIGVKK